MISGGRSNPGCDDSRVVDTGSLPLLSAVRTTPSFRLAFRGYDAREVDRYAHQMEAEIDAAAAVQRDLAADVRSLTEQLNRANEELSALRRRPSIDDTITFRHLGPRVEQILSEAHAEADVIRQNATENAAWLRDATEAHVRAVEAEHARTIAECEQRERSLRQEEEWLTQRLRSRQDAVARAEAYRDRLRRDAEQLLAAAQEQHVRLVASAVEYSEQARAHASAQAEEIRSRAEFQAAALVADAEQAAQASQLSRRSAKQANGKRQAGGGVEANARPR